ncbi:MAG TPA: hypothetical protein VFW22_12600 [Pseudolabrys sp.]|nr:hypothetical protein [Pseudolabrys sp.]
MKLNAVAFACAATLVFAAGASAQTVIEEHRDGVVVEHDHPPVVIEKHEHPAVVEKKSIETTGSGGCDSKTVHKETEYGSKTVHKTNCD